MFGFQDLIFSSLVPHSNVLFPPQNINERSKILKQIKALHALKVSGALTDQEFEDKKALLLRDFR